MDHKTELNYFFTSASQYMSQRLWLHGPWLNGSWTMNHGESSVEGVTVNAMMTSYAQLSKKSTFKKNLQLQSVWQSYRRPCLRYFLILFVQVFLDYHVFTIGFNGVYTLEVRNFICSRMGFQEVFKNFVSYSSE